MRSWADFSLRLPPWQAVLCVGCVAAPWLNPVARGAVTAAIPLLLGWVCTALLVLLLPLRRWSARALAAMVLVLALNALAVAAQALREDVHLAALAAASLAVAGAAAAGAALQQRGAAHWLAWAWLLAALWGAVVGVCQFFGWTTALGALVNHSPGREVFGYLRQRNQFATQLTMALWALWYLWQTGRLRLLGLRWEAVLLWGCMAVLTLALGLTTSRTGTLELLALMGMLWWWTRQHDGVQRKPLLWWLGGMAVVYVLGAVVLPWASGWAPTLEARMMQSYGCGSRAVLWSNVLHLIAQKPWTGWGWEGLKLAHYAAQYPGPRFCDILDNAHNLPLHLAVELGLPFALAFCALLAWGLWRGKPLSQVQPQRQMMWGVLAMLGIHSMLEFPMWYAPFQMACGLALGVLWADADGVGCGAPQPCGQRSVRARWCASVQRGLALGVLGVLAYVAFDYARVSQLYIAAPQRWEMFQDDTWRHAGKTIFYRDAYAFAHASVWPLTPENAQDELQLAQRLMRYSPEPRIINRCLDAALLLGRHEQAQHIAAQYSRVYPEDWARWLAQRNAAAPQ